MKLKYYGIYNEQYDELSASNCPIVNLISIEITKDIFDNIDMYMYKDGEIILDPDYEEKQKQKERDRINHLKMTKRVCALMLQQLGISYTELKEAIASSEQAQLEWDLCIELERGNPLINQIGTTFGLTSKQIDRMFQYANGEVNTLEVE